MNSSKGKNMKMAWVISGERCRSTHANDLREENNVMDGKPAQPIPFCGRIEKIHRDLVSFGRGTLVNQKRKLVVRDQNPT